VENGDERMNGGTDCLLFVDVLPISVSLSLSRMLCPCALKKKEGRRRRMDLRSLSCPVLSFGLCVRVDKSNKTRFERGKHGCGWLDEEESE